MQRLWNSGDFFPDFPEISRGLITYTPRRTDKSRTSTGNLTNASYVLSFTESKSRITYHLFSLEALLVIQSASSFQGSGSILPAANVGISASYM
jgi:hypothetical protein